MNKSPTIAALAEALLAAQSEMASCPKDGENPFFKSSYATLNAVREAVIPVLANHGLCIAQPAISNELGCGCETVLMHKSGEWISSPLILPLSKKDPQAAGSALSYARRYSLMSIACAVSGDDDDAEKAMGRNENYVCPSDVRKTNPITNQAVDEDFMKKVELYEIRIHNAFSIDELTRIWSEMPVDIKKELKQAVSIKGELLKNTPKD